eukprot:TRINITY_DN2330_c0_g3_i1.p1 TRINITY_DN2330_c0_g3~~TRINITY_DN2330_c0_g3_i1.p1  ORF type:complete len:320 (+),score=100.87 TRINITY_DN2330_c0_g3_i1:81-1040(+)
MQGGAGPCAAQDNSINRLGPPSDGAPLQGSTPPAASAECPAAPPSPKDSDSDAEVLEELRLATRALGWKQQNPQRARRGWVVYDAVDEPQCTVVLLHGLSGKGEEMDHLAKRLAKTLGENARIVCPTAPLRENYEEVKPAWFVYDTDMSGVDEVDEIDPESLDDARARLWALLEEELALLPDGDPNRLLLGGESQGGSMALDAAVTDERGRQLAGVLALRGLPLPQSIAASPLPEVDDAEELGSPRTPALVLAGAKDKVFLPSVVRRSTERMQAGPLPELELHMVPGMTHAGQCKEEEDRAVEFVVSQLQQHASPCPSV